MIGIVLVTHGRLAEEFVDAMVHVHGPQAAVQTVCIGPDDDMDEQRLNILKAVQNADIDGDGVIILTDMFGGTPSNLAISVMDQTKSEVIAGVNLPMLIKLASRRTQSNDLTLVATEAQEAGKKYISLASAILNS